MSRIKRPDKCLDQASAVKAREQVAVELGVYRLKYGEVAVVERAYAALLADYDARIAAFAAASSR